MRDGKSKEERNSQRKETVRTQGTEREKIKTIENNTGSWLCLQVNVGLVGIGVGGVVRHVEGGVAKCRVLSVAWVTNEAAAETVEEKKKETKAKKLENNRKQEKQPKQSAVNRRKKRLSRRKKKETKTNVKG